MTKDLRALVWDGMLTARLNVCYWQILCQKYKSRDKGIKIMIAIASSSTISGWVLWSMIEPVWQTIGGIAAVLAVISPILNYSKSGAESSKLYGGYVLSRHNWETLWNNIELGVEVTVDEYHEVRDRMKELEVAEAGMAEKSDLIEMCQQKVLRRAGQAE